MNVRTLIFAGTTEGRELAEFFRRHQISCHVCVATEYGGQLLEADAFVKVHAGRLNSDEMLELMKKEEISLVIDATHPYAVEVSENVKKACERAGTEYLRLFRGSLNLDSETICVDSVDQAVDFLKKVTGNILVTTGSKELHKYTAIPDYQERVFARVLSTPEVAASCAKLGFTGKNLICMQGPFSEELNIAMLKQFQASYLVTKDTGKNGGFAEKIRAAKAAGAKVVLIGRPVAEEGMSLEEVKAFLVKKIGITGKRTIAIVGIGMGTRENMTLEACHACEEAQLLIGAKRMLEVVNEWKKPTFVSYKPEEIRNYILAHPEYERVALLQSGDVGFYSGAKKLFAVLEGENIQVYPGISSVVYLCDKLHISWEDVKLVSLHGRHSNMVAKVKKNKKVFALIGKGSGVRELCEKFLEYEMDNLTVTVGENLSYPEERIFSGTPERCMQEMFRDLCVVLIENPTPEKVITHGIEDTEFIRDKVPMTKSEVRSISLSKMHLTKDAVVYDIGAGTGSVSIETALQAEDGMVYAIEKKPEAVELMKKNKRKFAADNLEIVEGLAPEALQELPVPTHVFVGGSSGNLKEIMQLVLEKNPKVRIVINCIALETVAEALDAVKTLPVTDVDMVSVSAAKSKELGSYHMMMGLNPVYVISCSGSEQEKK